MSRPLNRLRVNLAVVAPLTLMIFSTAIFASVSLANASRSLPTPPPANMTAADWPVNERGQTYGSSALAATPEDEPDLILASATNGKTGYISREEMRSVDGTYAVHTPEEALAWNAYFLGKTFTIPVYEVDGVTVIGYFVIGGGTGGVVEAELHTGAPNDSATTAVPAIVLTSVVALPDNTPIADGSTSELTATDQLTFAVTFENQGSTGEANVPVMVTLVSPTTPQQQMMVIVVLIGAKQLTTINVEGLNPTASGEQATLTVQVGPALGESYVEDNYLTATLVFEP